MRISGLSSLKNWKFSDGEKLKRSSSREFLFSSFHIQKLKQITESVVELMPASHLGVAYWSKLLIHSPDYQSTSSLKASACRRRHTLHWRQWNRFVPLFHWPAFIICNSTLQPARYELTCETCISFLTTSRPRMWSNTICKNSSLMIDNFSLSRCQMRTFASSMAVMETWK